MNDYPCPRKESDPAGNRPRAGVAPCAGTLPVSEADDGESVKDSPGLTLRASVRVREGRTGSGRRRVRPGASW